MLHKPYLSLTLVFVLACTMTRVSSADSNATAAEPTPPAKVAAAIIKLSSRFLDERIAARKDLKDMGSTVLPFVKKLLSSEDPRLRYAALDILSSDNDFDDYKILIPLLNDPELFVQQAAIYALIESSKLESFKRDILPELIALIENQHPEAEQILHTLGQKQIYIDNLGVTALPLIIKSLHTAQNWQLREQLSQLVRTYINEAAPLIFDKTNKQLNYIMYNLFRNTNKTSLPYLLNIIYNSRNNQVIHVLHHCGPEALPTLLKEFSAHNHKNAVQIAPALTNAIHRTTISKDNLPVVKFALNALLDKKEILGMYVLYQIGQIYILTNNVEDNSKETIEKINIILSQINDDRHYYKRNLYDQLAGLYIRIKEHPDHIKTMENKIKNIDEKLGLHYLETLKQANKNNSKTMVKQLLKKISALNNANLTKKAEKIISGSDK